jgi:hypothetical protein
MTVGPLLWRCGLMLCLASPVMSQVLSGRVVDARTGSPLPLVTVTHIAGDKVVASATTNDSGQFTMREPRDGKFALRFSRAAYRESGATVRASVDTVVAVFSINRVPPSIEAFSAAQRSGRGVGLIAIDTVTPWICPPKKSGYRCEAHGDALVSPGATLTLRTVGEPPVPSGGLEGTVKADSFHRKLIRISGDARTFGVTFNGEIRVRLSRFIPGVVQATPRGTPVAPIPIVERSLGEAIRSISGTTAWRHIEATLPVPDNVDSVQYGITLTGTGVLEVRNLLVEPVATLGSEAEIAKVMPGFARFRSAIGTDTASATDVIDALRSVERVFFHVWFSALTYKPSLDLQASWRRNTPTDTTEPIGLAQRVDATSHSLFHCHPDSLDTFGASVRSLLVLGSGTFLIPSGVRRHAICPSWLTNPANGRFGDRRARACGRAPPEEQLDRGPAPTVSRRPARHARCRPCRESMRG